MTNQFDDAEVASAEDKIYRKKNFMLINSADVASAEDETYKI